MFIVMPTQIDQLGGIKSVIPSPIPYPWSKFLHYPE
jgi:hypothetical protein